MLKFFLTLSVLIPLKIYVVRTCLDIKRNCSRYKTELKLILIIFKLFFCDKDISVFHIAGINKKSPILLFYKIKVLYHYSNWVQVGPKWLKCMDVTLYTIYWGLILDCDWHHHTQQDNVTFNTCKCYLYLTTFLFVLYI